MNKGSVPYPWKCIRLTYRLHSRHPAKFNAWHYLYDVDSNRHTDWLVQQRRNSSALAMELRLCSTNSPIFSCACIRKPHADSMMSNSVNNSSLANIRISAHCLCFWGSSLHHQVFVKPSQYLPSATVFTLKPQERKPKKGHKSIPQVPVNNANSYADSEYDISL